MRIAILTAFTELHDGYSLTHVVRNQIEMLTRYGHEVTVFVREDFSGDLLGCSVEKCIPAYEETKYRRYRELSSDHRVYAETTARLLTERLQTFEIVFTHDWIFLARLLPLAEALRLAAPDTRHLRLFHWIHSKPSYNHDWWDIRRYGPNQKIVYPTQAHAPQVVKLFKGNQSDVITIPHITDLRTLFDFSQDAREIIDSYPGLLNAKFVQVYAAASDRLRHKGLLSLIHTFAELKKRSSVCLLVVNSWTGKSKREPLGLYKSLAGHNGLTTEEFGFTSEIQPPKYETSVPRRVLIELMQCSNLFIFPSVGESFGLGIPETSLAGGTLPVLNKILPREVAGNHGLQYDFDSGSFQTLAHSIHETAMSDESWKARTLARRNYNMDSVYANFYKPLICEVA